MCRPLILNLSLTITYVSIGSEPPIIVTSPNLEQVYVASSLVAVPSNPERYLGKSVSLFGFYSGQSSLFLTCDDAIYEDYTFLIYIDNLQGNAIRIRESSGNIHKDLRGTLELAPDVSGGLRQFFLPVNLSRATLVRDASCRAPERQAVVTPKAVLGE
ncbi:MAG: hypothetical protein AAGI44_01110 [Pseudomonadota bacterium]